ncbi:MAG: hypothetical protein GY782_05285 [Gammaproteobacteria bacterium]|nr:hypothetical protein [Gammaproteobacteria bacterium]
MLFYELSITHLSGYFDPLSVVKRGIKLPNSAQRPPQKRGQIGRDITGEKGFFFRNVRKMPKIENKWKYIHHMVMILQRDPGD